MSINPTAVLYIKLGRRGEWEQDCIERDQTLRLGYRQISHKLCLQGKWDKVLEEIKTTIRSDVGAAARDAEPKTYVHSGIEQRTGKARKVRADAIEADVWDEIRELFQDPDKLWAELKAAQQDADDQLKPMRERLQITDDLIKHFQGEADKIAAALPDAEKGKAVWLSLKQSETSVNARLDELAKQREKTIVELGSHKLTDDHIETIMTFARRVRKGIDNATAEKILTRAQLAVKPIPPPREFSSDCGIALRFEWNNSVRVKALLNEARVEVAGIHQIE